MRPSKLISRLAWSMLIALSSTLLVACGDNSSTRDSSSSSEALPNIDNAQDAQVCAPAAGKVTAVDTDSRWGSVVCIEDSAGHLWRVCGTADPTVQTGDEVSVGQILGRAGSIPNECAEETHIHLEVLQGEQYLDPAKLLN